MNILIVDDKPDNLYLLELILKGNGYTPIIAKNGALALELARTNELGLIISDILMPVMDGFTLCRELKKDHKLQKIPFVFYTATYTDPKDEGFALSLGADRFLLKPKDPDELIKCITEVIDERSISSEIKIPADKPDQLILKEYNEALIRKLEDKMLQAEQAEREVRKYNIALLKEIEERKRAQEELLASELKYRSFFESSIDAIFLTSPDGKIISVNKAACEMLGYSEEEMICFNMSDFVDQTDTSLTKLLEERAATGMARGELRLIGNNGRQFPAEISSSLFENSKGETSTCMIIRDISERKENEKEIRILAQSLKCIHECVSLTDLDDKIIFVNESFLKTYGYQANELIGKHINILRPENQNNDEINNIFYETLRTGWSGELINVKKDGSEFPISLSTTAITDNKGQIIGLIGVAKDITESKRTEQELINAKLKAERSDKLKSEFLAQVSHEIRTPMSAILSLVSLLKDEFDGNESNESNECFSGIDSAGQRLLRTVDLILNVSEMQVGAYEPSFKSFDLISEVFKRIKTVFTKSADIKGLSTEFNTELEEAYIVGDCYSIYQIASNLVENAITFTHEGSISFVVRRNAESQKLELIIEDTGIGMTEEFMANMYEPFMQEDRGYTRKFEGNGLGLSLVKKYCDLNNIEINVDSTKGVGTKFTLVFNENIEV